MKDGRARKRNPSPYAVWEEDRFLHQDLDYLEQLQEHNHAHRQTRVTRMPRYDRFTHQRLDTKEDKQYLSHYHGYVQPQLMSGEEDAHRQHSYHPESFKYDSEYGFHSEHP